MRRLWTIAGVLCFFGAVAPLAARCALCRNVAAAQNAVAPGVIDAGIAVLFLPAVSVFSGVLFLAFRYRSDGGEDRSGEPRDDREEGD
jgi:hypothetical protein